MSGGDQAVETAVYILTTMVVLETAQHVLNIGQGIAEIDMSALTLHQIKNTVKRIEGKVDKILKEPLNTAKLYFDNALMEITNKSYSDAYQTLGAVHILRQHFLGSLDTLGGVFKHLVSICANPWYIYIDDII